MKKLQIKIDDYDDRRSMASIFMSEGYKVSQKIEKKGQMSYSYYVVVEDIENNIEVTEDGV